jgi:DNA-binding CsgD family transcriptional regulator/tetratricopeptide (TPR) repeat protein
MGSLKAALEDTLSGRGRLVMLVGEPGIGKTRTSQELAAYATLKGAQVLWGRCHAAEGAPPYWPWVQVVRSYLREYDPEQLRSQMGAGAADIAEVVPEVRERLPDLQPPPALEPQQARFRLFDSITKFFQQASQAQPLVVVLDNLHWADRPSLLLLEFLAQEIAESRLLLVGTYRDSELTRQHPLTQTLGELAREPLLRRVPLRGLSEEEVGRFIQATSGFAPPGDLVRAVHGQTGGSPLFMTEVVRLLVQEGELAPGQANEGQSWSILIPASVREVIGRRLDRLSERCNQVLSIASVIGREFELRLLERLMDQQSGDELLEALEEALAARVIEELPNVVGRYQFAHVLIQDTLARELSAARRARLHRRIGEALEELYAGNIEVHAAELAYHFAQAVVADSSEKLVHYSLLAGEQAVASYAWEDALAHFQQALAAKEGRSPVGAGQALPWGSQGSASSAPTGPAVDAETAALLFGLARAQFATLERHRLQEAMASLRRAFDYYAEAEDVARAVAVAEYPVPDMVGKAGRVAQLLSRALSLLPPESHAAGRLLSRYGRAVGTYEGDYQGAQEAFQRALAIAQRERDLTLELRTLASAAFVDARHLRHRENIEKTRRVLELARSLDDPRAEVLARSWGAVSLLALGELEEARRLTAAHLLLAERLRDRFELVRAFTPQVILARLEGNWLAAQKFGQRGLAVSPNDAVLLSQLALLEYQLGNFGQGDVYLERWLEAVRPIPSMPTAIFALQALVIPVVARITGVVGRADVAQATAEAVLSAPSVDLFTSMAARAGLALLAVGWGDGAVAGEQYAALKPQRGTMSIHGDISRDRLLGLVAQTMGNLDKAAAHFEDALAFCRKAGYRPELAWSCHDYAEALLQRNNPGDRQKAMALLEEALSISTELGMRPLMERVLSMRERAESHPARAPAYPDGLTQREVEVLRLVAAGKTDRQIAEELFISVTTASTHVRNLLNKTNTANRTEAAAYAAQHGLI